MAANEEYWLSGPIEGVPQLLQPVAHALLQARDEIHIALQNFPNDKLWHRPKDLASVGFHLQHIPGVLDRLFTYAAGKPLSPQQMQYLAAESQSNDEITCHELLERLSSQVTRSIEILKNVEPPELTQFRGVGRKQLPSNVIGLLFHAAEHTMRHNGQLQVTARMIL